MDKSGGMNSTPSSCNQRDIVDYIVEKAKGNIPEEKVQRDQSVQIR